LGKPHLVYSPIQPRMENQYCIFLVGRLENLEIDVAGVMTTYDFELIEIMGDKDPYPSLLRIDWAYDNYAIIDLKRDTMTIDTYGIKVVQPLAPCLGPRYIEPTNHNMESETLDQLYTITAGMRPNYINHTIVGSVSWRSIQSVDEDLKATFYNWQQGSYERFSRRCATFIEIIWIGTEVREPPTYGGTSEVHNFLASMEENITTEQRIFFLDLTLQDTAARWWATHKSLIMEWEDAKKSIQFRFQGRDRMKE
jgi:hypothetical protein